MKQPSHLSKQKSPARRASGGLDVRNGAGGFRPLLHRSGMLQSMDTGGHWIALKPGQKRIPILFRWDASTQFQQKDQPIRPADLQEGERVNIFYQKEEFCLLAKKIVIPRQHEALLSQHVPKTDQC